ncbi:DUF4382 domain-containing protein [Flavihumibacter solisilvae]|uniref:DUF4382 domain-containing protein n=1 Tax=Flavihumibacter solisilvae TaxID=1349421 RepID=A0A0C1L013_9BACT|nr:DUF4382 domain-containing protein [Flavihumibacter solisilvae]KIC93322.1 hypothetical protein OI18_18070 [Flavihumibacter solisilvae]
MKTNHFLLGLLSSCCLFFFAACSENNSGPDEARLQIRLTDAPNPDVKEVWVDIRDIQINYGDSSKWSSLPHIYPGTYDLLKLTDGKDTLLADATIPSGKLSQLRLILGDNNYLIMADGSKQMLTTPSAQQSGLKVQVHSDLTGGVLYRLILDFDAAKSIVEAGNSGKFLLKPVIRVLSFVPSGGIVEGFVAPDSVNTTIYALLGTDTIASTYTDSGRYMFRDIPQGNYSFHYYPSLDTFKTATLDVPVTLGQTTKVDTLHLELKP